MILAYAAADGIRRHAAEAYPDECCGALVGREETREIIESFPLPNMTEEGARRRFLVRPEDYRAAEAHARRVGAQLLGFYHSHPDHPARPSTYDLAHAWPTFSYVIVSVIAGRPDALSAWRLREDREAFEEEPVEVEVIEKSHAEQSSHSDASATVR